MTISSINAPIAPRSITSFLFFNRWNEHFADSNQGQRYRYRASNHSTISSPQKIGVQSPRAFICFTSHLVILIYTYGCSHMYVYESGMLSIHTQLLQDQVVKFYTSFYSSKKRWHDYLLEFQSCGFFFVNFCKFLLRHTQNSIFFIRSRFTGFPIFLTLLH